MTKPFRDEKAVYNAYGGKKHAKRTARSYRLTEALGILAEQTPRATNGLGNVKFIKAFCDAYEGYMLGRYTYEQAHERVLHLEDG